MILAQHSNLLNCLSCLVMILSVVNVVSCMHLKVHFQAYIKHTFGFFQRLSALSQTLRSLDQGGGEDEVQLDEFPALEVS